MSEMKSPPLRYALAMMRFTSIPKPQAFKESFHDEVRDEYPYLTEQTVKNVQFAFGPKGFTDTKENSSALWQFATVDKNFALIISADFLILHAAKGYTDHVEFIARFREAVDAFLRVDKRCLLTALGYRYVDVILPQAGNDDLLQKYLSPWVLPMGDNLGIDGVEALNCASILACKTRMGGLLRMQAFRKPPQMLPPGLDTPFVTENGWVEERPEGDFALLDLDHAVSLNPPISINPDDVSDKLMELQSVLDGFFKKSVTAHAIEAWN